MSQVIKIKRGGISGLSGASTVQGELIIATGSLGNNADGPFLLAHGDSLGLVAGAVFTGSTVPTISDSELNGILFYDSANSRFYRLDSNGNQALDIEATSFSGDTDGVSEGSTNLYFTNARADARIAAASVTDLSDVSNAGSGIIISATERTQLSTAAAFTASLDPDIATLSLPASTTISAFGKTLVGDADASTARTTLGVDAAGTDNSTDVTLATVTDNYLTISNQEITAGTVPVSLGGTGATTAAGARTALGVDEAGTDNSTDVTLAGSYDYITISGQTITRNQVDASTDISNLNTDNVSEGSTNKYASTANVKTALNTNLGTLTIGDSNDTVSVPGNLSVGGTLTTVSSNEVNIGDQIITLNTSNTTGDAGIQVHDIDAPASTGSLLYESEGNYWKAGVKNSEKRVVTFNADNPTNDSFIHLNGSDEIVAVASGSDVGAFLQKSAGGFTVSNVVDGGTY